MEGPVDSFVFLFLLTIHIEGFYENKSLRKQGFWKWTDYSYYSKYRSAPSSLPSSFFLSICFFCFFCPLSSSIPLSVLPILPTRHAPLTSKYSLLPNRVQRDRISHHYRFGKFTFLFRVHRISVFVD